MILGTFYRRPTVSDGRSIEVGNDTDGGTIFSNRKKISRFTGLIQIKTLCRLFALVAMFESKALEFHVAKYSYPAPL
jgi:hypothetical protein